MIGTPFTIKDEFLQRRIEGLDKKPWQQEARDDQGRKHFYGAFTGALKVSSVGYKGTVGSREGWAPKEFVSSRQQEKGDAKQPQQQNIFDFMDEEDIGEHLAGSTIAAHQNFDTDLGQKERQILMSSSLGAAPDELIIGTNEDKSKGFQLLKAMGFKDRGSSKFCFKNYEGHSSSSDDEDQILNAKQLPIKREGQKRTSYYSGPISFKDNFNGLGYQATPNEVQILRDGSISNKNDKQSKRIKMSEFDYHGGGGSDENEDDDGMLQMTSVYDQNEDRTSRYHKTLDIAEDQKNERKSRKHQEVDQNIQFQFGQTLTLKSQSQNLQKIQVPEDYNPFSEIPVPPKKKISMIDQIMEEQKQKFDSKFGKNHLNADQRAQILGEQPQVKQEHQPANSLQSSTLSSSFASQQNSHPSHLNKFLTFAIDIPFKLSDPGRFLRFKAYLLELEGQLVPFAVPNQMMTGSQLRLETEEFEKLRKLNKIALSTGTTKPAIENIDSYSRGIVTSEMKKAANSALQMTQEEVQKKIEEIERQVIRREERDWQPAHLLLTRCGIRDPHKDKKVKPPMFFKNHQEIGKGYTEFEKKDTLNQMALSTTEMSSIPATEDGNKFFNQIQEQFASNKDDQSLYVELEEEQNRLNQLQEQEEQEEEAQQLQPEQVIVEPDIQRPPISLFESIFNAASDEEEV